MGDEGEEDPMDIDLNLEPLTTPSQIESIDERIRRLEEVTRRTRHRWRRLRPHTPISTPPPQLLNSVPISQVGAIGEVGEGSVTPEERENQRCKKCSRRGSDLIAKALKHHEEEEDEEKESEKSSNTDRSANGYFDCNVCFDMASDPVLTSCGHLFCWACLYQWLHVHSQAKECPVCKGEVADANITPIYGRGTDSDKDKNKEEEEGRDLSIPPRPKARRIESSRQRNRRVESSFSIQELIQRIGSSGRVLNIREEGSDGPSNSAQSRQAVIVDSSQANAGRSISSRRILRSNSHRESNSQRGASASNLLTALNSADELVQNYFLGNQTSRNETHSQSAGGRDSVPRTQGATIDVDGSRILDGEGGVHITRRRRRRRLH